MKTIDKFDQFGPLLDAKCIVLAPFCGDSKCEDLIKKDTVRFANERQILFSEVLASEKWLWHFRAAFFEYSRGGAR